MNNEPFIRYSQISRAALISLTLDDLSNGIMNRKGSNLYYDVCKTIGALSNSRRSGLVRTTSFLGRAIGDGLKNEGIEVPSEQ